MGEEGGGAEVRVRLTVDDNDQQTTQKLKDDLKDASHEQQQGAAHAKNLGSELLKASLYTEAIKKGAELVAEGMHQAAEMAMKMLEATTEAADESNQQVRASAGLMSMMDRGAHSMGELRDYAKDVREELADAGTQAGVTTGTMEEMFNKIIERGNRSTEEAKELTAQMALVGKVIPQGMEGLAQGFNMMELGIVRARNPLVQLIASTGVLKGNAHDVAKAMMKMSPAEQIEKANTAIAKQAEILSKSGAITPTLPELKNSLSNIREGFLEAVGQPLLDKIIPPLTELRDFLLAHKEEIAEFGAEVGQDLGKVVDVVSSTLQGIYQGIHKNWAEISKEFNTIFGDWRAAWDYATEHTGEIKEEFQGIGMTLVHAFETVAKMIKAAAEVAMDANDWIHLRHAGTTQAEIQGKATAHQADAIGGESQGNLDESVRKYRALAEAADMDTAAIDRHIESMRDDFAARQQWGDKVKENVGSQNTDQIADAINSSLKQNDAAAEAWVFNQLATSDSMARALMDGAIKVDGGFEALTKVIEERSPDLYKKIEAMKNTLHGVGIKGQAPTVNFNGATINIKQDFRDQDPDRILRDFRKDLGRAAMTRRQSSRSTAYGL